MRAQYLASHVSLMCDRARAICESAGKMQKKRQALAEGTQGNIQTGALAGTARALHGHVGGSNVCIIPHETNMPMLPRMQSTR